VDYVGTLPARFLVGPTSGKRVLRAAFADLLPAAILSRAKRGFGVPLGRWFRHDLRDYVADMLLASSALSRDYVHPSYVAHLVAEHQAGVQDHSLRLWALLTFEVWLRQR
jgi:asparagine synthase (glutamine-hydrolysing)